MEEKDFIVSPDEAKAEQEALAGAKAEEVRAKVVADLGLTDDDTNKPVIDKIVARELSHKQKLSEAIGQKIKYREAAKTAKPNPPAPTPTGDKPLDPEAIRKQTEMTVKEQLEQRDLDEMEYPDDIKAEIKRVAQITNVSVRKAAKDPYIGHLIEKAKAENRITEAAGTRTPRSTPASSGTMPKFDMSTADGRKAYDEWKAAKKGKE